MADLVYTAEQYRLAVEALATSEGDLRERVKAAWFAGPSTAWAIDSDIPVPVPPATQPRIDELHQMIERVDSMDDLEVRSAASHIIHLALELENQLGAHQGT